MWVRRASTSEATQNGDSGMILVGMRVPDLIDPLILQRFMSKAEFTVLLAESTPSQSVRSHLNKIGRRTRKVKRDVRVLALLRILPTLEPPQRGPLPLPTDERVLPFPCRV